MKKSKIPVAVLGATGTVGQKFIILLNKHPQFEIVELIASSRSAGKPYSEACIWKQQTPLPSRIANLTIKLLGNTLKSHILFSGLDSTVAKKAEEDYANKGHMIISNASSHRMNPQVPLVIPEINNEHLMMIKKQSYRGGSIITNPNCSVLAIMLPLASLYKAFGIKKIIIQTMQAISGSGYPGVPSLDILGNVVPFIHGEEEKIESEPKKILGKYLKQKGIEYAKIKISAHCNRVPVIDGHVACVSFLCDKTSKRTPKDIREIHTVLKNFTGYPQKKQLYSAPHAPILISEEENRPQPILDIWNQKGMACTVGRIRPCNVLDYKFVVLGHNTIRGAAGAAILNAETMLSMGLIT